jgi:tetratricopeptide (TPR) repeat protein
MEEYQIKIKQFESEALAEFKKGNTDMAILFMKKAWDELPETKTDKPESYLIASSLIFALNKVKRYEEALDWARKIMICDLNRYDDGGREFISGTVLYHLGRKDDAWQYFDVANDKSEGRCFTSSDKEYLKFFKDKK